MSDESTTSVKKRGLGRGLSALFEDEEIVATTRSADAAQAEIAAPGDRRTLNIDQMEPSAKQPRRRFNPDTIRELAESIAVHGLIQPILVRPKAEKGGMYEIVAGERRWRAAQEARLHTVPVIIRSLDDRETMEIALVENLQREDLNALDEAQGYRNLMNEFGHSQDKAALVVGKSRSHVANMLRLLALPADVQSMVRDGRLSMGHARTLVGAANAKDLAQRIVDEGLSVREAEKLSVGHGTKTAHKNKAAAAAKDIDTMALEQEVSAALGMKVSIDSGANGAGTLKISFESLDQLDDVLHRLSHFPGRVQTG